MKLKSLFLLLLFASNVSAVEPQPAPNKRPYLNSDVRKSLIEARFECAQSLYLLDHYNKTRKKFPGKSRECHEMAIKDESSALIHFNRAEDSLSKVEISNINDIQIQQSMTKFQYFYETINKALKYYQKCVIEINAIDSRGFDPCYTRNASIQPITEGSINFRLRYHNQKIGNAAAERDEFDRVKLDITNKFIRCFQDPSCIFLQ